MEYGMISVLSNKCVGSREELSCLHVIVILYSDYWPRRVYKI